MGHGGELSEMVGMLCARGEVTVWRSVITGG